MAAILYTSGSTGKPKGVVLSHRNLIVGAESVSTYLENTADDVILSALPLSFDAGFSQLTTAFSVGAHVVLMNYLLAGDVVRLCARHGVTGLTCVPPLWIQIADQAWPPEATAAPALLRQHRRPDAAGHARQAAGDLPAGQAVPDVRPDRGVPLHLPRSRPRSTAGPTRSARRSRTPRSWWSGRTARRAIRAKRANWFTAARWSRWATGTTRSARPSDSGRAPGRHADWRTPEIAVWSGDAVVADEEGFLYFVGRKDEMIKTSGYRVSPTEIEEVAYAPAWSAMPSRSACEDAQARAAHPAGRDPVERCSELDADALIAAMKRELPLYMVPSAVVVPRRDSAVAERQVRPRAAASRSSTLVTPCDRP